MWNSVGEADAASSARRQAISRRLFCAANGGALALALGGKPARAAAAPPASPRPPIHRLDPTRGTSFRLDDPAKVAVLVIDMQNHFVAPGQPNRGPETLGIIPQITELAEAARAKGGLVVWTRHVVVDDPGKANPAWLYELMGPAMSADFATLKPGSWEHAIYDGLKVDPRDLVIDKYRFSAFTPDTAALHATLRQRGIDTLIITGTLTNICCQSTARDAMLLDYRVCMPPDATATFSDAAHNATYADLSNMGMFDLRLSAAHLADLRG